MTINSEMEAHRKIQEVEAMLEGSASVDPATLIAALRILVDVIKYLKDIKR